MIEFIAAAGAWFQPWLLKAIAHMGTPYAWVELFSAACALLGSLVLALKGKRSGWGWVLFAFSNAGWIVFAQGYGHWFFLVQQIGFSVTSGIGIWTYLIQQPKLPRLTAPAVAWRTKSMSPGDTHWKLTQTRRVAEIWREQGCTVEALGVGEDVKI